MSKNAKRPPRGGKKEPRADRVNPESPGRPRTAPYEVGYGKPPEGSRFVKGQSGNPGGRPRKPKPRPPRLSDAPSDGFLSTEAYRTVTLRENGKTIELPVTQAVFRSLATGAIKGNRLSQKYFLEHVAHKEDIYLQYAADRYARLETLKKKGEAALADHERRELPPPDLIPHPDDIVLNPVTLEAAVNGPETVDDAHRYDHSVMLREHLLLRSVHAKKPGKRPTIRHGDEAICTYLFLAQFLNSILPRRYRWTECAEVTLMVTYEDLPRRERERCIAREVDHLKQTCPPPMHMTPEQRYIYDRIFRQMFEKA